MEVTVFRIEHFRCKSEVGAKRIKIFAGPFCSRPTTERHRKYSGSNLYGYDMPSPYSDEILAAPAGRRGRRRRDDGGKRFDRVKHDAIPSPYYVCGLPSWRKLRRWFLSDFKYLSQYGYVIRQYRIPRNCVQVFREQVMFDARYARRIRTLRLTEAVAALEYIQEYPVPEHHDRGVNYEFSDDAD